MAFICGILGLQESSELPSPVGHYSSDEFYRDKPRYNYFFGRINSYLVNTCVNNNIIWLSLSIIHSVVKWPRPVQTQKPSHHLPWYESSCLSGSKATFIVIISVTYIRFADENLFFCGNLQRLDFILLLFLAFLCDLLNEPFWKHNLHKSVFRAYSANLCFDFPANSFV